MHKLPEEEFGTKKGERWLRLWKVKVVVEEVELRWIGGSTGDEGCSNGRGRGKKGERWLRQRKVTMVVEEEEVEVTMMEDAGMVEEEEKNPCSVPRFSVVASALIIHNYALTSTSHDACINSYVVNIHYIFF